MDIRHRKYDNYDEYLKHQSRKLDIGLKKKIKKFMPPQFKRDVSIFKKRFKVFEDHLNGDILCLGARLGCEVEALRDMGFKSALGIDLNPGKNNKCVIKGDFQNMGFKNESYDTIYTNAIDHAWDLKSLSDEIFRVLKYGGKLILEIDHLVRESKKERFKLLKKSSKYESVMYSDFDDVEKEFEQFNFIEKRSSAYSILIVAIFEKKEK